MQYRITALATLLVMGSSAYALAQSPAPGMAPAMSSDAMAKPVTFKLASQNGSGETGTAVLTQVGDDVKVVVTMTGAGSVMQPIHIHDGTCAKLDPKPKYPLATVEDGKSTTLVKGVKLASLENGAFAINVHKSTTDIPTYVSCGDIPAVK